MRRVVAGPEVAHRHLAARLLLERDDPRVLGVALAREHVQRALGRGQAVRGDGRRLAALPCSPIRRRRTPPSRTRGRARNRGGPGGSAGPTPPEACIRRCARYTGTTVIRITSMATTFTSGSRCTFRRLPRIQIGRVFRLPGGEEGDDDLVEAEREREQAARDERGGEVGEQHVAERLPAVGARGPSTPPRATTACAAGVRSRCCRRRRCRTCRGRSRSSRARTGCPRSG